MSELKELAINADRICEAISKIGYNPTAAITDIVDNSIVAGAKKITVQLFLKQGMNLSNKQNIEKIQIIDNGQGMTPALIEKALSLGDVPYMNNSLSKYGLGLKSAGFSLGNRIEVVSKSETTKEISELYYLDREEIRKADKFGYLNDTPEESLVETLSEFESGTIVTIENIVYTSRVSAGRIMKELAKDSGIIYRDYIISNKVDFKIQVISSNSTVEKEQKIAPQDILFWDEAYENFIKEDYDCKKPCKALDAEFENPLDPEGEKIRIQVVIFPMDKMKSYMGFSEEERKRIGVYEVGLKNSGFFFYRNGRLIKRGEKLFLNREFGFRAKISFSTAHDDLFDVDVSKQHLTISEDVEAILQTLTSVPRGQAKDIFAMCNEKINEFNNNGSEGAEFNRNNAVLEEEDDESATIDAKETLDRKQKLEQESSELSGDDKKYEDEEEKDIFRRVRYWDGKRNLWESATDRLEGTYVLINKHHPFYDAVLNKLELGSAQRQAFEGLLHSLAVGKIKTIEKHQEVPDNVIKAVFNTFERYTSNQIDNWVNNNWNIFDNED